MLPRTTASAPLRSLTPLLPGIAANAEGASGALLRRSGGPVAPIAKHRFPHPVLKRNIKLPSRETIQERRRRTAHTIGNLSVLQTSSVAPATQRDYYQTYQRVLEWESQIGVSATCEQTMDEILTSLFDFWYLEGEEASLGSKTLAAVMYFRKEFSRNAGARLLGARQAIKGWRKLAPPKSRLPLPWEVVAMIANHFVRTQRWEAAVLTLLIYHCYLRPGEAFRLRCRDLIAPVKEAGASHSRWSLTLHAAELGVSSKTHEYDESLQIDRSEFEFLGRCLSLLTSNRGAEDPLFRITQIEFARLFRDAVVELKLSCLGQVAVYQLRHAGASNDFAANARSLLEIQRRGRWRSTASVRRYEKGGRVTEQLRRLPPRLRAHAVLCGNQIAGIVAWGRSPLEPP
jgi:integrase